MDNNIGNRAIHSQRMSGYRDVFKTNGQIFISPSYDLNFRDGTGTPKRYTYIDDLNHTPTKYTYGTPNDVMGNGNRNNTVTYHADDLVRTLGKTNRRKPQQSTTLFSRIARDDKSIPNPREGRRWGRY